MKGFFLLSSGGGGVVTNLTDNPLFKIKKRGYSITNSRLSLYPINDSIISNPDFIISPSIIIKDNKFVFDGSTTTLYRSNVLDETRINVMIKFKPYDLNSKQTLWKSGGLYYGLCFSINDDGNFGFYARYKGTLYSLTLTTDILNTNNWYLAILDENTKTFYLVDLTDEKVYYVQDDNFTVGNGTDYETVGGLNTDAGIRLTSVVDGTDCGTNNGMYEMYKGEIEYILVHDSTAESYSYVLPSGSYVTDRWYVIENEKLNGVIGVYDNLYKKDSFTIIPVYNEDDKVSIEQRLEFPTRFLNTNLVITLDIPEGKEYKVYAGYTYGSRTGEYIKEVGIFSSKVSKKSFKIEDINQYFTENDYFFIRIESTDNKFLTLRKVFLSYTSGEIIYNPHEDELRCKRFYQFVRTDIRGYNDSARYVTQNIRLSPEMRTTPIVSTINEESYNSPGVRFEYADKDVVVVYTRPYSLGFCKAIGRVILDAEF